MGLNFVNWYMSKLHKAAHRDAKLSVAFVKVAQLMAEPPTVMSPRLAWRVMRGGVT